MSESFDFREPARVTLGSVGPPGQRVFYLQARQGPRLVSLKLEKQQVAFLMGGLSEVLADVAGTAPPAEESELEEPVEEAWAVGSLELAYDPGGDRIVLVALEVEVEDDAGDQDEPEEVFVAGELPSLGGEATSGPSHGVARLELTRDQAAAMIEEGKRLLRGGRPRCSLCGYPLTEDHSCPRTNGHRAPSL